MIYLDANIFVYAIINNGIEGERCRKILNKFVESDKKIVTSVLTWDEVVYSIWKKISSESAIAQGRNFLNFPNLTFLSNNLQTIDKAQEIIEKLNLKPRDAIHLATALLNNCNSFVTDDSDFDKIKGIKIEKI